VLCRTLHGVEEIGRASEKTLTVDRFKEQLQIWLVRPCCRVRGMPPSNGRGLYCRRLPLLGNDNNLTRKLSSAEADILRASMQRRPRWRWWSRSPPPVLRPRWAGPGYLARQHSPRRLREQRSLPVHEPPATLCGTVGDGEAIVFPLLTPQCDPIGTKPCRLQLVFRHRGFDWLAGDVASLHPLPAKAGSDRKRTWLP
jgi:hypothetical protein